MSDHQAQLQIAKLQAKLRKAEARVKLQKKILNEVDLENFKLKAEVEIWKGMSQKLDETIERLGHAQKEGDDEKFDGILSDHYMTNHNTVWDEDQ